MHNSYAQSGEVSELMQALGTGFPEEVFVAY